jgi:CheY-like chemotaxis protein
VEELNENRGKIKHNRKKVVIAVESVIERRQLESIVPEDVDAVSFNNGLECIHYIKTKGSPNLLIIDVDLPQPGGIKTVENLRGMGYGVVRLPVVFVSSHKDKDTILHCRDLGVEDYILKPLNSIFVQKRVEMILEKDKSLS